MTIDNALLTWRYKVSSCLFIMIHFHILKRIAIQQYWNRLIKITLFQPYTEEYQRNDHKLYAVSNAMPKVDVISYLKAGINCFRRWQTRASFRARRPVCLSDSRSRGRPPISTPYDNAGHNRWMGKRVDIGNVDNHLLPGPSGNRFLGWNPDT